MNRSERLDYALNLLIETTAIPEDDFHQILTEQYTDCDDWEAGDILKKLINDGYIFLDDNVPGGAIVYYLPTRLGIYFLKGGGYIKRAALLFEERTVDYETKLNHRDLSRRQLADYTSPKWTLYLGIAAVLISGFFSALNYFSNKPTNQINHLERRIDSLQTLMNSSQIKWDTLSSKIKMQ